MNYIEYMSGGGVAGNDTVSFLYLPPHMGVKEMKHFVTEKPVYPSYFVYPNFVKFFNYGFGQNKNPHAKSSTVSTNAAQSDNNAEISNNRNIPKLDIVTFTSVLNNTLNRIEHLITNNKSRS